MNYQEVITEINDAILDYENSLDEGLNKGNDIEAFQRGCIVGLNKALSFISQLRDS